MQENNKKSEEIVRTIKLLESVLKTTNDETRKARVKKDLNKLRTTLKDMYPDSNLKEIENAIYAKIQEKPVFEEKSLKSYKHLKDIKIEVFSNYKEDAETNEAGSIMNYFQEKIWVVISDQYIKLDFSNASERDTLYRKLDECNRYFKTFCQTIEDIDRARSNEYQSQLHLMRVRHGRLFLIEIHEFFKAVKKFISTLLKSYESGGNMIMNPDSIIEYAEYEEYPTYQGWTVLDALKSMNEFTEEALDLINIPDLKQH